MTDNNQSPELRQSKDGSSTLYSNQFNQYYHNPNGAVSESLHVFFEASGLQQALQTQEGITVFEIGFGTGLNFLLLMDLLKSAKSPARVDYYSIEAFPISDTKASGLNYSRHIKHPELANHIPPIFEGLKTGMNNIKPDGDLAVELHLFNGTFDAFNAEQETLQADFIFHDAFSPDVNPELWTVEAFAKLMELSKQTAVMATYCAASKARAAMATAGWLVARAPGALGKREMSLASPMAENLSGFKRVNEERLANRMKNGDFD